MGHKRPWKVRGRYEHTKRVDPETQMTYLEPLEKPAEFLQAFAGKDGADLAARTISRNGGTAIVLYRDPTTGEETEIRRYAEWQVAMEEATAEVIEEMTEPPEDDAR